MEESHVLVPATNSSTALELLIPLISPTSTPYENICALNKSMQNQIKKLQEAIALYQRVQTGLLRRTATRALSTPRRIAPVVGLLTLMMVIPIYLYVISDRIGEAFFQERPLSPLQIKRLFQLVSMLGAMIMSLLLGFAMHAQNRAIVSAEVDTRLTQSISGNASMNLQTLLKSLPDLNKVFVAIFPAGTARTYHGVFNYLQASVRVFEEAQGQFEAIYMKNKKTTEKKITLSDFAERYRPCIRFFVGERNKELGVENKGTTPRSNVSEKKRV